MRHFKIISLLVVFSILFSALLPVSANHSFHASPVQICLNGAIFDGSPTASSALNLSMVSQIYDAGIDLIASGNSHTFTSVGETARFQVNYPVGTFGAGDAIVLSVSDIPGTPDGLQGFADFFVVSDCLLVSVGCNITDGRINNGDCAAPVAIYVGSVDIYAINPTTGSGDLVIRMSDAEIEEVGVPTDENVVLAEAVNPFTGQPITLYRLTSGQFQVNTSYGDGKSYIVGWSSGGDNLYHQAQ